MRMKTLVTLEVILIVYTNTTTTRGGSRLPPPSKGVNGFVECVLRGDGGTSVRTQG